MSTTWEPRLFQIIPLTCKPSSDNSDVEDVRKASLTWIPSSDNYESSDDDDIITESRDDDSNSDDEDVESSSSQQIEPVRKTKCLNSLNGDIIITINEYFFHFVIKITNQGQSMQFYFNPRCFKESQNKIYFLFEFKQSNGKYFLTRVSDIWFKPNSQSFTILCHWLIKLKSLFGNRPTWFGSILDKEIIQKYLCQFHHGELAQCLLTFFVNWFNKLNVIIQNDTYELSSSYVVYFYFVIN